MKSTKTFFFLSIPTFIAIIFIVLTSSRVYAETPQEKLERLNNEIEQYQTEIAKLQTQANTLSNQIAQYDAQIKLTTLKITETEEKITLLGGRIDLIQTSLDSLNEAFENRVKQSYKMTRVGQPFLMLAASENLSEAISSFHYLQRIQEADKDLLDRLENTKSEYTSQKSEQESLQDELVSQKKVLDSQKAQKSNLLQVTRNDEKKYQELLAQVKSEFEAIQAIIAGKGEEAVVGHVNQGDKIASIIQGASCNSSAAHLHFMIAENGNTSNPFSYLSSGISVENCSGSTCGSGDADPFNPSGSWNWPIDSPVKYTQGYGYTWAVQNTWVGRIYQFHNGIDINNSANPTVKAVKAGTLYQGSYTGYNGCRLRYVRVDHDDSNLDTFYLHINY